MAGVIDYPLTKTISDYWRDELPERICSCWNVSRRLHFRWLDILVTTEREGYPTSETSQSSRLSRLLNITSHKWRKGFRFREKEDNHMTFLFKSSFKTFLLQIRSSERLFRWVSVASTRLEANQLLKIRRVSYRKIFIYVFLCTTYWQRGRDPSVKKLGKAEMSED